jgi:hypothetical protein
MMSPPQKRPAFTVDPMPVVMAVDDWFDAEIA